MHEEEPDDKYGQALGEFMHALLAGVAILWLVIIPYVIVIFKSAHVSACEARYLSVVCDTSSYDSC